MDAPVWTPPTTQGETPVLRVHNSLHHGDELVEFVPNEEGKVSWYICGPTVYGPGHLGHARNYVSFDIIRRILSDYFKFEVFSVMNITDVDDKIILKARREQLFDSYVAANAVFSEQVKEKVLLALQKHIDKTKTKYEEIMADQDLAENVKKGEAALTLKRLSGLEAQATCESLSLVLDDEGKGSIENLDVRPLAARYEKEFLEDLTSLGVRMPDVVTRVTEYIPEIIAYVQQIMENGYCYESNGSVYFDTIKYLKEGKHQYPKLQPQSLNNKKLMEEGEGALNAGAGDKRNPEDFALWKNSKVGECSWPSPWGDGRPGWHIECSVMASQLCGEKLDIHAGGQDLKFPHHDNEIAQCEAYFGCEQWVNYFFHSGHLDIEGLKMSKSLKNFITIRQALAQNTPRQLRLFFVSTKGWDCRINYDPEAMVEVKRWEANLASFFAVIAAEQRAQLSQLEEIEQKWGEQELALNKYFDGAARDIHAHFCDNFNTRRVLLKLIEIAKEVHSYVQSRSDGSRPRVFLLSKFGMYVTRILRVMGVVPGDDVGMVAKQQGGDDELIEALCKFRETVRALAKSKEKPGKYLQESDRLRDEVLPPLGVKFDDSGNVKWKKISKAEGRQWVRERRGEKIAKLKRSLEGEETQLKKMADVLSGGPEELKAYQVTEEGKAVNVVAKDGSEVKKNKKKNLVKMWRKHKQALASLQKRLEKDPQLMENKKAAMESIRKQLEDLENENNNNNDE